MNIGQYKTKWWQKKVGKAKYHLKSLWSIKVYFSRFLLNSFNDEVITGNMKDETEVPGHDFDSFVK